MSDDPEAENDADIIVTLVLRKSLRAEIRRTGVTAIMLFKRANGVPEGLTPTVVNRWIGGIAETAKVAHLEQVTALWAKLPDDPGRITSDGRRLSRRGARHPSAGETWIEITTELADHLNRELKRTDRTGATLLADKSGVPAGLTPRTVHSWQYGHAKRANAAYWSFVIERLQGLPDRVPASQSHRFSSEGWKDIADSDRAEMRSHRKRTGIGGTNLLREAADAPAGLTPAMISHWLTGHARTARPDYVAYVLARYRAWP